MTDRLKAYGKLGLAALIVVILDQGAKLLVRTNLRITETWMPIRWLEPFFRFIHWKNTGVAFGLFQGNGWVFTVIGLALILFVILIYKPIWQGAEFWRIALGLELGGALGNFLDRINPQVGYVVDFIWVGKFPVFNLADAAIVIGAVVLVIGIWQEESEETPSQPAEAIEPAAADPFISPVIGESPAAENLSGTVRLPELPPIEGDPNSIR